MNFAIKSILKNSRGNSLISAMITVSLTGSAILYASMSTTSLKERTVGLKRNVAVFNLRASISQVLENKTSWKNTIESSNNTLHSCRENLSECVDSNEPYALNLYDHNNDIFISSDLTANKYNQNGEHCEPKSDCPYYVAINWLPICLVDSGDCSQVSINVNIFNKDNKSLAEFQVSKNYYFGNLYNPSFISDDDIAAGEKLYSKVISYPIPIDEQVKVKLFIILDPSESMADNMAKVKSALKELLMGLDKNNAQVYFYSTASGNLWRDYNGSPRYFAGPINVYNKWIDYYSKFQDHPNISVYDVTQTVDTAEHAEWEAHLKPDFSAQLGLPITSDLTPEEIESRLGLILNKFDVDPATSGVDVESGLCSLARILTEDGPNKIIEPGDQPHFIIVSDEDESTLDAVNWVPDCVKKVIHDYEITVSSTSSTVSCDPLTETCDSGYLYTFYSGQRAYIKLNLVKDDSYFSKNISLCWLYRANDGSCKYNEVGTYTCDKEDLALYTGSATILSCEVVVKKISTHSSTKVSTADFASLTDCNTNVININGVDYSGAKDFVNKTKSALYQAAYYKCYYRFLKYELKEVTKTYTTANYQYADGSGIESTKFSQTRADTFIENLANLLKTNFGDLGYSVSFYIHDEMKDNGLCVPDSPSQYGEIYTSFKYMLNAMSVINSICTPDYSVQFNALLNNVKLTLSNSIKFSEMDPKIEVINAVWLYRNEAQVFLNPEDYNISGNTVVFKQGILQDLDTVKVKVAPL